MVQFVEAWIGLYARQNLDGEASSDQQAGQGLIEYALLIWLIAIIVFVAVVFLRDKINGIYTRIASSVPN